MKQFIKNALMYCGYLKFKILRFALNIFNIFPIVHNRVLFHSFNGKQYSCNPRAISEALQKSNNSAEIVWAFSNPQEFSGVLPSRVKTVKMKSLKYYYYAKTAKVIVFNARGDGEISRKKQQSVIQTWHASNGYKHIVADKGVAAKKNKLACKDFTHALAGTKMMERERIRGTMHFRGPIIEGTPRMDIIIKGDSNEYRKKVLSYLGLDEDCNIVLFAPTYRSRSSNEYGMEHEKVLSALERRFGGKWVFLIRLHYFVAKKLAKQNGVIDVTNYPDMQDLLMASDVLISDYSSCIWDYSYRNNPCFLLCKDLDTYKHQVDFNIPIEEWGFPISKTMEELVNDIEQYDQAEFEEKMKQHHGMMGSYEDGHSTERVLDLINSLIL